MNNLLERLEVAIADECKRQNLAGDKDIAKTKSHLLVGVDGIASATLLAKTAITAICDEIDEGGIEHASISYLNLSESNSEFGVGRIDLVALRSAITAYLAHIKSTTEIKE